MPSIVAKSQSTAVAVAALPATRGCASSSSSSTGAPAAAKSSEAAAAEKAKKADTTEASQSTNEPTATASNTAETNATNSTAASDAGASTTPPSSSSSASAPQPAPDAPVPNAFGKIDPNEGPLKVNDDGEFEPMRWISVPYEDPALAPKVDEKGEYIVSKGDWPTGEMAYRPLPRTDVTPRFGYNIVSVKKPQTYWQYWRKNEHFNVTYIGIQAVFIFGMAWLMGFLYDEIRMYENEGKSVGNHAGEVRGKGRTDRKKQKIEFTPAEQDVMLQNAQESYITGAESKFLGNREYKMKKISRPDEYNYDDFRKR